MPLPFVSTEGWAAYVELLGEELGVFNHPHSRLYASEWRVLRALRVLIDIGLHYDGWSEQQAQQLWMQYLPEQPDIMLREIKRIQNWPVQVITYVYGKYRIEQALAQIRNTFPQLTEKDIAKPQGLHLGKIWFRNPRLRNITNL